MTGVLVCALFGTSFLMKHAALGNVGATDTSNAAQQHTDQPYEQPRLGQNQQDASCDLAYKPITALQAFTDINYSHGLSNKSHIQDKSPANTYKGQVGKQQSKHTGSCTGTFSGICKLAHPQETCLGTTIHNYKKLPYQQHDFCMLLIQMCSG